MPNGILEDFSKGILRYNEMRIALFVIRESHGYIASRQNPKQRRKWTKPLTHKKFGEGTKLAQSTVTTVVNSMLRRNILQRKGKCYLYNDNKAEWLHNGDQNIKNFKGKELLHKESIISIESIENLNTEEPSTASQTSDSDTVKEIFKQTNKENSILRIVDIWNDSANKDKKLSPYHGNTSDLKSIVNRRLKNHTMVEIEQAIINYNRYLCLPNAEKGEWKGYIWDLCPFLQHQKDNISRYKNWKTVCFNNQVKTKRKTYATGLE